MQSSAGEEEREMMATTNDVESTGNSSIPDEILVSHILPRLDVHSLARFMSTSTHGHSAISAPSFLLSHLSYSLRSRPNANLTLLFRIPAPSSSAYLIYSAAIPTTKHPQIGPVAAQHNPCFPGFPYKSCGSYISQSIHGLILLEFRRAWCDSDPTYICNPTTRRSINLPIPPPLSGPITPRHYRYSFGFDPARNQHKVLLLVFFTPSAGYEKLVEYWVFTLIGGGEWRPISCPIKGYYSAGDSIYINGSVYRWANHGNELQIRKTHVLEFDIGSEEFRFVELPDEVEYDEMVFEGKKFSLAEIDGHLGIIDCRKFEYGGNVIKIWVLEGSSNWVKRSIMFPVPDWGDIRDPPRLWYKGTIYTGEMMFAPNESTANSIYCVFFYDITVNLLRRFDVQGLPEFWSFIDTICIVDHVETLLSLPRVH